MEQTKIIALRGNIRKKFRGKESLRLLGVFLLGSIIAGGQVLGGMAPFGAAFFASVFRGGVTYAMIPIFSVVGFFATGDFFAAAKSALAMLFYALIHTNLSDKKSVSNFVWGSLLAVSHFLAGILVMLGGIPLLYDILNLLLESLLAGAGALSFLTVKEMLEDRRDGDSLLPEEASAAGAALGLFLLGLGESSLFGIVRPAGVLGVFFVLFFAYRYGAAAASAVGCAVGFFVGMSGFMTAETLSAFAFSGLLAGLFSRFKKWGVSLGFLLGNAVFAIILSGSRETVISIYEVLLGIAVFSAIPEKKLTMNLSFSAAERSGAESNRLRSAAGQKLLSLSASFSRLEKAFEELREQEHERPMEEKMLFERVMNGVCRDCSLKKCCYGVDRADTFRAMDECLESLRNTGELSREQMPRKIRDNCVRQVMFLDTFTRMYEIYKIDRLWGARVEESRQIVVSQMGSIARMAESLAEEIREGTESDPRLEYKVRSALKKGGVKAREVEVIRNREGLLEVRLALPPCGGFGQCKHKVLPILSATLGRPMERLSDSACGSCALTFSEARKFEIVPSVRFRKATGSSVSGDSYRFMNLTGGIFAAALSDGMGTGKRAARESAIAAELISLLLSAGFHQEGAVAMVNSLLVTRSVERRLSAVDLLTVHQGTGKVEFTKAGASASFILRKNKEAEIFECSSLPVGAQGRADMEILRSRVSDGDRIILLSDGVGETLTTHRIAELLEEFPGGDEGELAEYMMEHSPHDNRDDCTCLVLGVHKRAEEKILPLAK